MPRYTFELHDGISPVEDGKGVWLDQREQAVEHAEAVAHE